MEAFLDKYGKDTTTNFQLMKYAKELNIKPFYCIMRNELKNLKTLNKNPIYIICNYQTTNENGTHWIAMFKDLHHSYYFDSYGIQPFEEAIQFLDLTKYIPHFKFKKKVAEYVVNCVYLF